MSYIHGPDLSTRRRSKIMRGTVRVLLQIGPIEGGPVRTTSSCCLPLPCRNLTPLSARPSPPPPPLLSRSPPVLAHISRRQQKPIQSRMADAAVQDAAEQLLYLKLAFLAGEPPACVLALARYAPPLALSSQNRKGTQRSASSAAPSPD